MSQTVAIIGTGPDPNSSGDHDGYSMGYRHARAYREIEDCQIVSCADLDHENAVAFAQNFDLCEDAAYTDHTSMLDETTPDLVSICTPPSSHRRLVSDCAAAGAAVHCEKPMAETWSDCTSLVAACEDAGVQLTFNFQNRFRPAVRELKRYLSDDAIGDVERVEVRRADLMQTGIHNLDLATYFAGDVDIKWALGAVDATSERKWYTGMYAEDHCIGQFRYENGVEGLIVTGDGTDDALSLVRVEGTSGTLELTFWAETPLRIRRDATGWESLAIPDGDAQVDVCHDVVEALRTGHSSAVRAERALRVTELVFGLWESARTRHRVEFPIAVQGNPLQELVENR